MGKHDLPAAKDAKEAEAKEKIPTVSYEGVHTTIAKGQKADVAALLEQGVLVTDTGAFDEYLDEFRDRQEFSDEEIDEIYKKTMLAGVVDHHAIDAFFGPRPQQPEKCATQMIVEYKETALEAIQKHGIKEVNTHYDSDMDAVTSAYFMKHLIEHGDLPAYAEELAEITNKLDYGRLDVDPQNFVDGIAGFSMHIKLIMKKRTSAEIKEKGFSPAILSKNEAAGNAMIFELYNAIGKMDDDFDLSGNVHALLEHVSPETKQAVLEGRDQMLEDLQTYEQEFEKAERFKVTMENKRGEQVETEVILASSETPLVFTNVSYMRVSPDTIVAVYAGPDRKEGDQYDIGVIPDMGRVIDLRGLAIALNKAEKAKRDAIREKTNRTEEEQLLLDKLDGQKDRNPFEGIDDVIASGELSADDISKKDPTVLVAGESLIAASRSSQLSEEEFKNVVKQYLESLG